MAQPLVDATLAGGAQVGAEVTGANAATSGVAGLPPTAPGDVAGLPPTAPGDSDDETTSAWIGAAPEEVGLSRPDLVDADGARPAPVVDAAVAAALATGADVRVLLASSDEPGRPEPNDPGRPDQLLPDGLGALLRW